MPKKRAVDSCPNRLFLCYLEEWRDKAEEKGTKAALTYNRAYRTLSKYPLPLKCGEEAKILENFGEKICKMLDQRLAKDAKDEGISSEEYLEKHRFVHPSWWKTVESQITPAKKRKKEAPKASKREYIPQKNSGPYSLLITLYKDRVRETGKGYMTKSELINEAQELCDKSFSVPDSNSFFTAWSSMATLITKELVKKYGNPAKYELTEKGVELTNKLYLASNLNLNNNEVESVTSHFNKKTLSSFESVDLTQDEKEPKTSGIIELVTSGFETKTKSPTGAVGMVNLTLDEDDIELISNSTEAKYSSQSTSSSQFSTNSLKTFTLCPGQFRILLCVDVREIMGSGKTKRSEMKRVIKIYNIPHVERCLNLGDFLWVAQEINSNRREPREMVLDYIVERKCVSDLAQSIRDGRYREQKLRLKRSQLKNVVYLVEDLKQIEHQSLPEKTLRQAIENTRMVDEVHVQLTKDIDATALYLQTMTKVLNKMYNNMTLHCVEYGKEKRKQNELFSYGDYNESGSKYKNTTTKQLFTRQLMLIHGMSFDKAATITNQFPTIQYLLKAYESCSTDKEKLSIISQLKCGVLQRSIGANMSKTVQKIFET